MSLNRGEFNHKLLKAERSKGLLKYELNYANDS